MEFKKKMGNCLATLRRIKYFPQANCFIFHKTNVSSEQYVVDVEIGALPWVMSCHTLKSPKTPLFQMNGNNPPTYLVITFIHSMQPLRTHLSITFKQNIFLYPV